MSNTDVPVKENTFSAGQTILSALINQNFDQLFSALADIGTANLLADAVTEPKIINGAVSLAKLAAAVQAALCPTGTVVDFIGAAAPTGWLLITGAGAGLTIGNASSSATARANADTETLFLLLWNSFADAEAAVSGGRGASAAADFAANKRIALPDAGGRTISGKEASASRLTSTFFGAVTGKSGATLGAVGGLESHTLTTAQIASHNHTQDSHNHTQNAHQHQYVHVDDGVVFAAAGGGGANVYQFSGLEAALTDNATATNLATTATNQAAGGGGAHNNTQPTMIMNKIIKL